MSSFASGRSGSGRGSISTVFAKSLETICKDELGVRVSDGGLCVFFPMNNATHPAHTHHDTRLPGLLGHVVTAASSVARAVLAAACACDHRLTALVFPLRAHVFLFFHLLSVFSTYTITNKNNSHTPNPPTPPPPPRTYLQYALHEEIGKGGYATVYRCTSLESGEDYAVKVIDLRPRKLQANFDQDRLLREVRIMQRLHHPNIVRLHEVQEYDERLFFVMEYAPGRELFESILDRGRFSEDDARPIMAQILSAVTYLHDLNIVHRDIKPENILLLTNEGPPRIKLIDFGLSKIVGGAEQATTFVGTPQYYAPEVDPTLRSTVSGNIQPYGVAADCWSVGAVLYVMLAGRFPEFRGTGVQQELFFNEELWAGYSEESKDLIASLMTVDVSTRLSIRQVGNGNGTELVGTASCGGRSERDGGS